MKKSPANKGKRILAVILGIVWAILVVIAVYDVVEIYNYNPYYTSGANYTTKKVLSKDYGSIYYTIQLDVHQDFEFEAHPEYDEIKAIHDYLEAVAQYRMYSENGLTEKAKIYRERMDEARTRLGKLDFTAEDMDKMVGLK